MKDTSKVRFVSDVDMDEKDIKGRKPFKVSSENQRRFVRLEISSPMWLKKLKDVFGNFWPDQGGPVIDGTILNISGGGVLVELGEPVNEGDIVSMCFTLQGEESLESVLGLVKRSDVEDDFCLVGIEFVDRRRLRDLLSQGELDILSTEFSDFGESVKDCLQKYLYNEKTIHG